MLPLKATRLGRVCLNVTSSSCVHSPLACDCMAGRELRLTVQHHVSLAREKIKIQNTICTECIYIYGFLTILKLKNH